MDRDWPCVTCPGRETGLCGAMLGKQANPANLHQQPNWQHYRLVAQGEQIAAKHQVQENIYVLCVGWAYRFFQLADGRRQILSFLLPGDIFSALSVFQGEAPSSIKALTQVQLSAFRRTEVRSRCAVSPDVAMALAQSVVEQGAGTDELLTAVGQRSAEERIAYLFLHLMRRVAARSVIRDHRYAMPLRQQHIADTVGLTSVHVSRILSLFRERKIASFSSGILHVQNPDMLERIGALE